MAMVSTIEIESWKKQRVKWCFSLKLQTKLDPSRLIRVCLLIRAVVEVVFHPVVAIVQYVVVDYKVQVVSDGVASQD